MVVVWRVKVTKHCQCFNLGPTTPSSNHGNSPALVLDPILAPPTTERVGAIKCPGLISKLLQIRRKCPAQDAVGLSKISAKTHTKGQQGDRLLTTGSCVTAPCLFTLRNRGPDSLVLLPYNVATWIKARSGHINSSTSLAYSRQVCSTPVCADLRVVSLTSK